jgi:hypothetical protein
MLRTVTTAIIQTTDAITRVSAACVCGAELDRSRYTSFSSSTNTSPDSNTTPLVTTSDYQSPVISLAGAPAARRGSLAVVRTMTIGTDSC